MYPFQQIELYFQGDFIDVQYRASDIDAVERGEKVYMEVYQSARDFVARFNLPQNEKALSKLLQTGRFLQMIENFEEICCQEMTVCDRIYQAHDGMYGVLKRPDEWESAQLPNDWPSEDLYKSSAIDDLEVDAFFLNWGGLSAAGATLTKATLTLADGTINTWSPPSPICAADLGRSGQP